MATPTSPNFQQDFGSFLKLLGMADPLPFQVTLLEALLSSSDLPQVSAGLARYARMAATTTPVGTSPLRGFTPSNIIIMDDIQYDL